MSDVVASEPAAAADRLEVLPATIGTRRYRYPGSPPFRDNPLDRLLFKGRNEEARTVLHSILASDLLLLYAVSGLGKTSLLNAGVMQPLRDKGYWPVSVRLNDPGTPPVEAIAAQIAEAAAADRTVDLQRTFAPGRDRAGDESLWDLLGTLEVWRDDWLQHLVIVLDQFEELFTLDWDPDVRARFVREFGEVVRGHRTLAGGDGEAVPAPRVKFVLVIREDALGELEALAEDVPRLMQHRFRLGPLDRHQAEAAIREPARIADAHLDTAPFDYTEDAATEILDFLQSAGPISRPGADVAHRSTGSVDPSQLQLICQYVEQRVLPTKPAPADGVAVEIAAGDLGGPEGLRSVLGDFYRQTIESRPEKERRAARRLCETGLISGSRRRLSLEEGEIEDQFDVPPETLHALVDARLLRADPRVGSIYYELAHDTLVEPILNDRAKRQAVTAHRRQRRMAVGIGVVVLALVVALAVFLASKAGDGDAGGTPSRSLGFGDTLDGSVARAGDVEAFSIRDRGEPSLLVVRPAVPLVRTTSAGEGLNAVVDLRRDGVQRQQDQLGPGQTERLVVPALPDDGTASEVRVTSFDSTTGTFEIEWQPVEVTPLTKSSVIDGQAIPTPGTPVVFAVEGNPDTPTEVVVTPVSTSGAGESKLDLEVEVIDPSGIGRRVDVNGSGQPESVTVAGPAGQHLVVVRGYQASTGQFDLETSAVSALDLSVGQAEPGLVATADDIAEFAFEAPPDRALAVVAVPRDLFDPILEVVGPDGTEQIVDNGGLGVTEIAPVGAAGRYSVRVSGWEGSTGDFELTAVEVGRLEPGSPVEASGVGLFDVDVAEDEWYGAAAAVDSADLYLDVTAYDPDGTPLTTGASTLGDSQVVTLGGVAGVHRIAVLPNGDAPYSLSVEPLAVGSVEPGAAVAGAGSSIFPVEVDAGERLEFAARPGATGTSVHVQAIDPTGVAWTSASSRTTGAAASTVVGTRDGVGGLYQVVVVTDGDGGFSAGLSPADVRPLRPGAVANGTGSAVFEVDVDDGRLFQLSAAVVAGSDSLDVWVLAPESLPYSGGTVRGGEVSGVEAIVGGALDGTYEVVVAADADTVFTATLAPVEAQPLGPGETIEARGGTAFEIAVEDGPVHVDLVPGTLGTRLVATVFDGDGLLTDLATSIRADQLSLDVGRAFTGEAVPGTYRVVVSVDGPPAFEARASG